MIITPKVGDWVVLKSVRPLGWNSTGEMDQYLGKTVKVTFARPYNNKDGDGSFYFEGGGSWSFQFNNIESIAEGCINNNYSII